MAAAPLDRSLRPVLRPNGFQKRAVPSGDSLVASAKLRGRTCFAVADALSGERLEGSNSKTGAPPASVAKAVTALYALDALGSGHKFSTRVLATGPVEAGVLKGDLILAGGGDPTLDTDALANLAKALKESGLREVRGDFKVYDGFLPFVRTIDDAQPDHVGYSPAVSGISLNFNRVHFEWRKASGAYNVSMDARSERYRPDVYVARMSVADRRAPVYEYRDAGSHDAWSVARSALGNGGARWLPVRKPALYAGDVFQTLARAHGIPLKTPVVTRSAPRGQVLAQHQSVPLGTILRDMLKFSTNLTAEMVGMAATRKRKGSVQSLRDSAREMSRWAEQSLAAGRVSLVDHSGLGDKSRITADGMVAALHKAYTAGMLRPLLKPFGLRDAKGRPLRNHPIKVDAKTGTLNFVSGLAGYMTARDGRVLAFAIFSADEETRARIGKANREAPQGARSWNRRAKTLQQKLIERWGALYSG